MEARHTSDFTQHAQTRLRQRGVALSVVELLMDHGDIHRHAGDGAVSVSISRDEAAMLVAEGMDADVVSRARKLAAVLGRRGLVTILRPIGREGRRYRRQHATRNRGLFKWEM